MKKLTILLLTFLFSVAFVFGQAEKGNNASIKESKKEQKTERVALRKLDGADVSSLAKDSFFADFGNIPNVKWKRVGPFDEAAFTKNGKALTAFYDFNAKLVGTTQDVTFADVPASGQKEIQKQYKGYTIGPVVFFDDVEANEGDMLLFGSQFAGEDNYFVELAKGTDKVLVQVNSDGNVFFFKQL